MPTLASRPLDATLRALVVTAVLGVALALLFWRRQALRLKLESKLRIAVRRDPSHPSDGGGGSDGLLRFVAVDASTAGPPLLTTPGLRLLSLGDYFASLQPEGPVSWQRALVSIGDRFGLTAALPLALFLPNRWRDEACAAGLLARFPSLAASALVTTAISTLDAVAFAQTTHLVAAGSKRRRQGQHGGSGADDGREAANAAVEAEAAAAASKQQVAEGAQQQGASSKASSSRPAVTGPLHILRRGGSSTTDPLEGAPTPLLLTRPAVLRQLGLSEEEAADGSLAPAPEAKPLSPLLPDLFIGNGGLTLTQSAAGAATCRLMAAVANRLTANALHGLSAAAAQLPAQERDQVEQFAVCLEPGGPQLTTLEGLLDALEASGHSVDMRLLSNLTSFGVGFSVRGADGSWQQVPICYPMRCAGLWATDEAGSPLDVVTLISHGSIVLRCRGPLLSFDLEWCLNVSSFTGWLPLACPKREWANGPASQIVHPLAPLESDPAASGASSAAVLEQQQQQQQQQQQCQQLRRRLVRLITAATCIADVAAQRDMLLFGGYGMLGVCLDSVALIQQAMAGCCTIFPLLLGGEAKFSLLALYRQAAEEGWVYAAEARQLAAALGALPCDALQEPATAADAARRALACLPQRSVFSAVESCRQTLQAALAAAEQLCPPKGQGMMARLSSTSQSLGEAVGHASRYLPTLCMRRRGIGSCDAKPPAPPPLPVWVQLLSDEQQLIEVPVTATLEELQLECERATGVPPELQRLCVQEEALRPAGLGGLLTAARRIGSREQLARSLQDASCFFLVPEGLSRELRGRGLAAWTHENVWQPLAELQAPPGTVRVLIATLDGRRRSVLLPSGSPLQAVQRQAQQAAGLAPEQQRLLVLQLRPLTKAQRVALALLRLLLGLLLWVAGWAAVAFRWLLDLPPPSGPVELQLTTDDGRELTVAPTPLLPCGLTADELAALTAAQAASGNSMAELYDIVADDFNEPPSLPRGSGLSKQRQTPAAPAAALAAAEPPRSPPLPAIRPLCPICRASSLDDLQQMAALMALQQPSRHRSELSLEPATPLVSERHFGAAATQPSQSDRAGSTGSVGSGTQVEQGSPKCSQSGSSAFRFESVNRVAAVAGNEYTTRRSGERERRSREKDRRCPSPSVRSLASG
ncbi:Arginine repressor [Chlorella sorokiniana]|uniref:Arginine repressor n=1 Tax=Chlorella sorokiniana TaxID=3076 RepID=A0A2P6TJM2_CHLSO|nr:Arginine repressor [Chlorella sorokiniana]|eukprot:PRW44238.1 Arginine repressor [Chlorella sorokiniana]